MELNKVFVEDGVASIIAYSLLTNFGHLMYRETLMYSSIHGVKVEQLAERE